MADDPTCPICDRPAQGGTVCHGCAGRLRRDLEAVADVRAELVTSVARLGVTGGGAHVGRSAEKPLPIDLAALEASDQLDAVVVGWCRVVVEERGVSEGPAATGTAAAWLVEHVGWLRQHPAGDDACREVSSALRAAERAVDPGHRQRRPIGVCACGETITARPDDRTTRCRACDTGYDVATVVADSLDQGRDWLASANELAVVLAEHLPGGLRADRVRQWASRGLLDERGRDGKGRPLYRIGDVIDLTVERRAAG